ncbi:MAG: hypothetical protein JW830_10940, partial [Bacteroidales bacterium]|nr:hypothetical protein [Bacteroidales bacterium]
MNTYIYLSVLPEALIASMLPPKDFAEYLATGTRKKTRGQAIFFEVDQDIARNLLPSEYINKRCVRKPDGSPKSSVYLSVYRALEHIPLRALRNLFLVTEDGRMLELRKGPYDLKTEKQKQLHLYQELCPVTPIIASNLSPSAFAKELTSESEQVYMPKLMFVELMLDQLALDPVRGSAQNLPYTDIGHLRDCLIILKNESGKTR